MEVAESISPASRESPGPAINEGGNPFVGIGIVLLGGHLTSFAPLADLRTHASVLITIGILLLRR